jgi:hypothetical protein
MYENRYWGALIINSGATNYILNAVSSVASYDSSKVATFIIDQGRGGSYIYGAIRTWASGAVGALSAGVSQAVLTIQASQGSSFGALNPAVVSTPVGVTFENLHPVPFAGLEAICGLAPTFIYFAMNMHVAIVNKAHEPLRSLNIRYHDRLLALCIHVCIGSILLALWPSLTVLWLGYDMTPSTFFQFWAMSWIGMTAFGSMFMISFHVFGEAGGALMNILVYTIGGASGAGTVPQDLQSPFFLMGKALPYYNIVSVRRYILFGAGDSIGWNVGVQLIWIGATFIFAWRLVKRRDRIGQVIKVVEKRRAKCKAKHAANLAVANEIKGDSLAAKA